jgi:TPR repeat protein
MEASLNSQKAAKWFHMAALQGHGKAQYRLGVLYEKGIGVPQNLKEALKWKRMAAAQGEARAQNHLGVKYAKGKGVRKNYRNAYMWLCLAAMQGSRQASKNVDILIEKMTPEQLSDAKQLVEEWRPKT